MRQRSPDFHHSAGEPIPRLGGVALVLAFLAVQGLMALLNQESAAEIHTRNTVCFAALGMFGLGLWDDLNKLGAKKKLLGQVLIAGFVCVRGLSISLVSLPFLGGAVQVHWLGIALTLLWVVGLTNLINLLDGTDGLAAGISLMLMLLMAYLAHAAGHAEFQVWGMIGALLAFLRFNFPPARIYLGDSGAYFVGSLLALISLTDSTKGDVFAAMVAPMFVLALPILDTSLAVLSRGLKGLPVFRPDRRHLHHRLLRVGFSKRRVLLWFYGLTLVFLALGFAVVTFRGLWLPIFLGLAMLVLLVCARSLSFSRRWFNVGGVITQSLEMRDDIRYGLSLMRFLELEGGRCKSMDDLWASFLFAAEKLGYTSATLMLKGHRRHWQAPQMPEQTTLLRHQLPGEAGGVIELRAPLGQPAVPEAARGAPSRNTDQPGPVGELAVSEILSELLAEGWVKAQARWDQRCARSKQQATCAQQRAGERADPVPEEARLLNSERPK